MHLDCFNHCRSEDKICPVADIHGQCSLPNVSKCFVYKTIHIAEARLHNPMQDHFDCAVLSNAVLAIASRFQDAGLEVSAEDMADITLVTVPTFLLPYHPGNVTLLWHFKECKTGISWVLSPYPLEIHTAPCCECGVMFEYRRKTKRFCSEACQKRFNRKKARRELMEIRRRRDCDGSGGNVS